MMYKESPEKTRNSKEEYLEGIERLIINRERECIHQRENKNMFNDADNHRKILSDMLGWPLGKISPVCQEPDQELLSDENDMQIYRMRFLILPEITITGLFLKHKTDLALPISIVSHGGLGTPEMISGFYGSTSNYNDMTMRVFEQGINVFSPQLLLWDTEKYGINYDRTAIDIRLKRVGSSITAIEMFGLLCAISYFEKQRYVSNIGMVGLSYGGFYTLLTAAIDTRIKASISCSYFNDRSYYQMADWMWANSAALYSDAEIACLVYPRKLWLCIGDKDELFPVETGAREFARLLNHCRNVGTDWLNFTIFDGTHEFIRNNEIVVDFSNELKIVR